MTQPPGEAPELAERIAAAVRAHPSVAALHGGAYGEVATHLPGRRLVGVHVGAAGEPVEVGVVLYLDRPIPETLSALRGEVTAVYPGAAVDIIVGDVVERLAGRLAGARA